MERAVAATGSSLAAALATAVTAAPGPQAGPARDIAEVCAATTCRAGGFDAVVGVDAERFTTVPVSHSPFIVDGGTLLIFPGETVAVTFSIDGDVLKAVSATRYKPQFPATA
jgi:hypothetical protein